MSSLMTMANLLIASKLDEADKTMLRALASGMGAIARAAHAADADEVVRARACIAVDAFIGAMRGTWTEEAMG
jgi:hypothetical protein